jgi:hypothetical protein
VRKEFGSTLEAVKRGPERAAEGSPLLEAVARERLVKTLTELSPSFRSCQLCSYSTTSQHFMEPEGSLPCSQEPYTCPYPEPDRSSPYHPIPSYLLVIYWISSHGQPQRGGPPAWGLGVGLAAPRLKKISLLRKTTRSLGPRWIPWISDLSERGKDTAGWKRVSGSCGDLWIVEISGVCNCL